MCGFRHCQAARAQRIEPGEHVRSGRWWWENTDSRECGLHPRVRVVAQAKAPA